MNLENFSKTVQEAIDTVPVEFQNKIRNVAFVIEKNSRSANLKEQDIKYQGMLLGLYQGVPLPNRSAYYSGALPDKITIFQQPIEKLAGFDDNKINDIVKHVVQHEIAHYFGMDESRVRSWEKKRSKPNK